MSAFKSTWNGSVVKPLLQKGWTEESPAQINPVIINHQAYELSSESKFWNDGKGYKFYYNYYIKPLYAVDSTVLLKAGDTIKTHAMSNLRGAYAYVFFMGQNGGFTSADDYINQLKAMIAYSECDRYVVISFHKKAGYIKNYKQMMAFEDSVHTVFGKHFINLRDSMVCKGLDYAGLKPTSSDIDSLKLECVPPQLLIDGVHFTDQGYSFIARLVAEKFKQLNY